MDTNFSHIFNPVDDTLEAKIQALREVIAAYKNLKASESKMNDAQWSSRLGSEDEIKSARNVIHGSIQKAKSSISEEEMRKAKESGLISNEEIKDFIVAQRSIEQSLRKDRSTTQHKTSTGRKI